MASDEHGSQKGTKSQPPLERTIILVEDDASVASVLQRSLRDCRVVGIFDNADAVLSAVPMLQPDLALVDVGLSGSQDGVELAIRLRVEHGVRTVFVTGRSDRETIERCKAAEPLGYLVKPVAGAAVDATVAIALHHVWQSRVSAAEVARREQAEEQCKTILQNAADAIVTFGTDGHVLQVNTAGERLWGAAESALQGMPVTQLFAAAEVDGPTAQFCALLRLGQLDSLLSVRHPLIAKRCSGRLVATEATLSTLSQDEEPRLTLIVRDVSERRGLLARVSEAERLETVGRMVAEVAHSFNNSLQALNADLFMLAEALRERTPLLEEALEVVRAAGCVSRGLLRFSGTTDPVEHHNLTALVTSTVDLGRKLLGNTISLTVVDEAPGTTVALRQSDFQQVVLNLLLNAREAMADGGAIHLRLGHHLELPGFAVVECEDTGPGVAEDVVPLVFNQFFTTKSTGSGLGLSSVRRAVESWGGSVTLRSVLGSGAKISLSIPIQEPNANATTEARDSIRLAGNLATFATSGRVLLVEDAEEVRVAMRRLLTATGLSVRCVSTFQEARAVIATDAGLNIVVCESFFPGGSAAKLSAYAAQAGRADLPFLVLAAAASEVSLEAACVLLKPVPSEALLRALKSRLGHLLQSNVA